MSDVQIEHVTNGGKTTRMNFKQCYLALQNETSGNFPGNVEGMEMLRFGSKVYSRQGPCLFRFNSSSVSLGYRGDMASSSFLWW